MFWEKTFLFNTFHFSFSLWLWLFKGRRRIFAFKKTQIILVLLKAIKFKVLSRGYEIRIFLNLHQKLEVVLSFLGQILCRYEMLGAASVLFQVDQYLIDSLDCLALSLLSLQFCHFVPYKVDYRRFIRSFHIFSQVICLYRFALKYLHMASGPWSLLIDCLKRIEAAD